MAGFWPEFGFDPGADEVAPVFGGALEGGADLAQGGEAGVVAAFDAAEGFAADAGLGDDVGGGALGFIGG